MVHASLRLLRLSPILPHAGMAEVIFRTNRTHIADTSNLIHLAEIARGVLNRFASAVPNRG